jgi:dTDP-glucose 4,6-dehydratase
MQTQGKRGETMKILVTGGCGFIGSHFIRHLLSAYPQVEVVNYDALTYACHPKMSEELAALNPRRYELIRGDIADPNVESVLKANAIDTIVNFAAETHVDRSIIDPTAFVRTNINGLQNLLVCARKVGKIRFIHVSTDEVYGTLTPEAPPFTETSPLDPNSPYAASKASADLLALASHRTYGQEVLITRCSNNFGPYQFPEKLLPLVIANALENKPIPVYGDGKQVRDWIYVEDHCRAIAMVMEEGRSGEIYNVSAQQENFNLEVIEKILAILNVSNSLITFVGDRPAHDRRYALQSEKIRKELGWKPEVTFDQGLAKTVEWYLQHQDWWKQVRGEAYYAYYQSNYKNKFQEGRPQ